MIISEIWPNDSVYYNELFYASRIDIVLRDRVFVRTDTLRGDGVVMVVRRELSPVLIDFNCSEIPYKFVVIVKVKLGFYTIHIINVHVAPQCSILDLDRLVNKLVSINKLFSYQVLILYFNITDFF